MDNSPQPTGPIEDVMDRIKRNAEGMNPAERYRRQLVLDAPSGDVCSCGEIHESALAEEQCEAGGDDPNPLGLADTQQLITGGSSADRAHGLLVEAFLAGEIDAHHVTTRRS